MVCAKVFELFFSKSKFVLHGIIEKLLMCAELFMSANVVLWFKLLKYFEGKEGLFAFSTLIFGLVHYCCIELTCRGRRFFILPFLLISKSVQYYIVSNEVEPFVPVSERPAWFEFFIQLLPFEIVIISSGLIVTWCFLWKVAFEQLQQRVVQENVLPGPGILKNVKVDAEVASIHTPPLRKVQFAGSSASV
ncbi:unnamed protein product [Caenorhabditis angaria]|uniref:Uncharacterized protein n=1 Tax=Caenorhabditis angaria TaxID=860376 RepID=A0A9P1J1G4_9PELO|nr:unnamed protein product [Caenorhabditis angaria]